MLLQEKKILVITLFPFIAFIGGYWMMAHFLRSESQIVPNIVGKEFYQAAQQLRQLGLTLTIIAHRQESVLPEGTIMAQKPLPEQNIKKGQAIYVTTAINPPAINAPILEGALLEEVQKRAASRGIHVEIHYIVSHYPNDMCFAQYPKANTPLKSNNMIAYISKNDVDCYVMPSIIGLTASQVHELLASHNIELHGMQKDIHHALCSGCMVINQRPNAGESINFNRKLHLYVQYGH